MKPTTDIIKTSKLERTYGQGATLVHAVDKVDLTIQSGEFTAIVGPSGSGKSTLLNLISGLDQPTSGTVILAGQNLSQMSGAALSDYRRDHIGFIFQNYNLLPVLTAAENVEYVMLLQGVPSAERATRTQEILAKVGLGELGHRRPRELSGGQQQRVAVARAIVTKPEIILADEPTANLDSKSATDLIDMMRSLNEEEGTTFLFSTHDQKVMDHARRLITLEDGHLANDDKK